MNANVDPAVTGMPDPNDNAATPARSPRREEPVWRSVKAVSMAHLSMNQQRPQLTGFPGRDKKNDGLCQVSFVFRLAEARAAGPARTTILHYP